MLFEHYSTISMIREDLAQKNIFSAYKVSIYNLLYISVSDSWNHK